MKLEEHPSTAATVVEVETVPAAVAAHVMIPCDACSTWCRPAAILRMSGLTVAVCKRCFGPGGADHVHRLLGCIRQRCMRAVDVLGNAAGANVVLWNSPPADKPSPDENADQHVMH